MKYPAHWSIAINRSNVNERCWTRRDGAVMHLLRSQYNEDEQYAVLDLYDAEFPQTLCLPVLQEIAEAISLALDFGNDPVTSAQRACEDEGIEYTDEVFSLALARVDEFYLAAEMATDLVEANLTRLIDEYSNWNGANRLSLGSADEHINDPSLTTKQRAWLFDFSARWEQTSKVFP
jgi:hypothetical protein